MTPLYLLLSKQQLLKSVPTGLLPTSALNSIKFPSNQGTLRPTETLQGQAYLQSLVPSSSLHPPWSWELQKARSRKSHPTTNGS